MININHISFITNKRDKSIVVNKPLLKLDTIIPYVPLLSTEATLGFFFMVVSNSVVPLDLLLT